MPTWSSSWRWRSLLGLLLAVAIPAPGATPKFPTEPLLRIDADAHGASVTRISVDRNERYLVSGSHDKTVRVWALSSGELLRVLRLPIGEGNLGKVYAAAISPDGEEVAVGGFTGMYAGDNSIFVFDRQTGKLIHRVPDVESVMLHLRYSPDGRYLAATLGGGQGLRVYETEDFEEIGRDTTYGEVSSYWADFDTEGRLVTTAWDGELRLYEGDFSEPALVRPAPGGERPFGVAFSPNGRQLAVGYDDSTRVDVFSADSLALLYTPESGDVVAGNLSSVAWSADGQSLFAGGRAVAGVGSWIILRRWSEAGRGEFVDTTPTTNTIMGIVPLADGRIALGAQDPWVGVLAAEGDLVWANHSDKVDFRGQEGTGDPGLRVSRTGAVVEFGLERNGERRVRFDVEAGRLELDPPEDTALRGPSLEADGLSVTDWEGEYSPQLNDAPLELEPWEVSRSLAIGPEGQRFVLGTEWSLRVFDADGDALDRVAVPGIARAINITPDGQRVIAGFNDGTLRWYRLGADGTLSELLALYALPDGRWVAWTPEGFFDAAAGGEALIGYHLNRGADETPDFVGVDQLYDLFYRPDLVAARFLGDEAQVRAELARIGDVRAVLARGLPPVLVLVGAEERRVDHSEYTVEFELTEGGGGLGEVIYQVNGVVIDPPAGRLPPRKGPMGKVTYRQPLPLVPGENVIEVRGTTRNGEIESPSIRQIVHVMEPKLRAPALYGIAIGINAYRDNALALKYASPDAQAVAATLGGRGAGLFREVDVRTLVDREATLDGIETAFAELAPKVEAADVFVLYLAGHGQTLDGRYHFFPWEFIYGDEASVRENALSQERLTKLLQSIRAQKSLVVLDTCQSGGALQLASLALPSRGLADKAAIARLMRATGRDVLAASATTQQAYEGKDGHGVFTYALLEGLKGGAERNADDYVDVDELGDYVVQAVPELTLELWDVEQFPQRSTQRGAPYPIAVVSQ